jgi:hypothetical protein
MLVSPENSPQKGKPLIMNQEDVQNIINKKI